MTKVFPPKWEQSRYDTLKLYKDIYDGELLKHVKEEIPHLLIDESKKKFLYIVVNFAAKISKYFSSLILGKEGIYFDSEQNQEKIDQILKRNKFDKKIFKACIDQSRYGYFFLRVRKDNKNLSLIEQIQNDKISVEYDHDERIKSATLFSYLTLLIDEKEKKYLYKEIYSYPNGEVEAEDVVITRELWEVNEKREVTQKVSLAIYSESLEETLNTGLPLIPVFRFDNPSDSSQMTGESDYKDLLELFKELNDKTSSISKQLRKHMASKIAVPSGTLTDSGDIKMSEADLFEVGEGEMPPQYIVNPNPQIDQAFKHIENILREIAAIIQIPIESFGIDQKGGVESPEGFRLRMFETTQKINSKRLFLYDTLVDVMQSALEMEGVQEENLEIVWSDPLPIDSKNQIDVLSMQVASKLKAKRTAIKELQMLDEEQLNAEMKLIEGENSINPTSLDDLVLPSGTKKVEEDPEDKNVLLA